MNLMDALLSRNQITQEQAQLARRRQELVGGLDGENLRALFLLGESDDRMGTCTIVRCRPSWSAVFVTG